MNRAVFREPVQGGQAQVEQQGDDDNDEADGQCWMTSEQSGVQGEGIARL